MSAAGTLGAGAIELAERGLVPLPLLRRGVRASIGARKQALRHADRRAFEALVGAMREAPVALDVEAANAQHYELPPEFFSLVLGARRKYSGCLFERPETTLDEAEEAMLALTIERAGVADGMEILELGCGWGSLSLELAERFPNARILAVSNSSAQRPVIEAEAGRRGLRGLAVETADMNRFATDRTFDRIVSVEMFEHMRNWPRLFGRLASWLAPRGAVFLHVFCHRATPYFFETVGEAGAAESGDWMARHFFTGGLMPTPGLVRHFDDDLVVESQWEVDGTHYARTAAAWRANLERRRLEAMPVLRAAYGAEAPRWFERWRIFFLACEELFASGGGREWFISHTRLRPR